MSLTKIELAEQEIDAVARVLYVHEGPSECLWDGQVLDRVFWLDAAREAIAALDAARTEPSPEDEATFGPDGGLTELEWLRSEVKSLTAEYRAAAGLTRRRTEELDALRDYCKQQGILAEDLPSPTSFDRELRKRLAEPSETSASWGEEDQKKLDKKTGRAAGQGTCGLPARSTGRAEASDRIAVLEEYVERGRPYATLEQAGRARAALAHLRASASEHEAALAKVRAKTIEEVAEALSDSGSFADGDYKGLEYPEEFVRSLADHSPPEED